MIGVMVKAMHKIKLEQQMATEAACILQEEIDWEVLCDVLTEINWTKIKIDWPTHMSESDVQQIKEWCRNNLQGNYHGRNKIWIFEKEKDATLFALRWV